MQREDYSSRKLVQESDGSRIGEKFSEAKSNANWKSARTESGRPFGACRRFIFLLSRLEELHNK